jgi:YhcH/YjgK/YiaL family protein
MIIDTLKNSTHYQGLCPRIVAGLDYLKKTDFSRLEPGKYEIDGSNLFALLQSYETKPRENGKWEAHRKYIDIQFIAQGIETMGYANLEALTISQPYNDKDDYLLLEGKGDFLTVSAGTFILFAPQDAHMPGLAFTAPAHVTKVVVKVLI